MKRIVLAWLKKIIDKLYYKEYTQDRETLIRQMFPGVHLVGEYKLIDIFFKQNSPQQIDEIIKLLGAYYRGENQRLTLEGNFSEIKRYQGLLDLAESLRDYQEYILHENVNKK